MKMTSQNEWTEPEAVGGVGARVAIQGYEGSFHHIVARRFLGERAEIVPCDTFREVARQVESGGAEYGIMAIENSIAGSILPNLGILHNSRLQVTGEYYLHIRQNLMALPGVGLEGIEEVHSHPMSLASGRDRGYGPQRPAHRRAGHPQCGRHSRRFGRRAFRARNRRGGHPLDP